MENNGMGKTPPDGMALSLHPIGLAAWFGFLATALNLLPIGQLDGGHTIYALFPTLHKRISQVLVIALVPPGIWFWPGWLLWFVLLLVLRLRHPMTMNDSIPLDRIHFGLSWLGLAMFVLCFMPTPIYASSRVLRERSIDCGNSINRSAVGPISFCRR